MHIRVVKMAKNYIKESLATPHHRDGGGYIHPSAKVHGGKAYLDMTGGLIIDEGVIINQDVVIYTHNHRFGFSNWREMSFTHNPLLIEKDVWIGRNAMIMPSVDRIGESSVIAPGSIVTKNIPNHEMWGGNPAKFIKKVIH